MSRTKLFYFRTSAVPEVQLVPFHCECRQAARLGKQRDFLTGLDRRVSVNPGNDALVSTDARNHMGFSAEWLDDLNNSLDGVVALFNIRVALETEVLRTYAQVNLLAFSCTKLAGEFLIRKHIKLRCADAAVLHVTNHEVHG